MTVERHYFPGNNTSLGFFSYYKDALYNTDNKTVYILKGGPGCGKSTLMRKVAENFKGKGFDIDYLHCSGDVNSLDGVRIPSRNLLFVDGTSPHTLDPKTPGGNENIINLGRFWSESDLREQVSDISCIDKKIKDAYKEAYSLFGAAGYIYDILDYNYKKNFRQSDIMAVADDICKKEMGHFGISTKPGKFIRGFASALTHEGIVSYIKSLIQNYGKIYILEAPFGLDNSSFFEELKNHVVKKGFDCEAYYCPIRPDKNIEHLLIPELNIAFTTVNKLHELSPWELYKDENDNKKINVINIKDYILSIEDLEEDLYENQILYKSLLIKGMKDLKNAKLYHDKLEEIYVKAMNFGKSDKFIDILIENIV